MLLAANAARMSNKALHEAKTQILAALIDRFVRRCTNIFLCHRLRHVLRRKKYELTQLSIGIDEQQHSKNVKKKRKEINFLFR